MKIIYAHIIIIDDNHLRRNTLAYQLQNQGYAISTASSDEQPMALLATDSFDLVLISVEIASGNNYTLLQQIRHNDKLSHLPVIIITDYQNNNFVAQCLEQGATDYLFVPTNPTLIKKRIYANLQQERLQNQLHASWNAFNEMERLADDLRLTILPLGIALSAEKDFNRLLERIVVEAKSICNADGGTLYLRTADDHLRFAIVRTASLGIALGGTTEQPVPYPSISLYDKSGQPNHYNVAAHVVFTGESENIADIYEVSGFDFSDTKAMDERNNYRSQSCLTVPLKNQMNGVVGVLQLLNTKNEETHEIVPFDVYHQLVVESLASQAAVVLHNQILRERHEALREFQQQLEIGRQIQQNFFPDEMPQPDGWELVARFHPAREVAGDFYDAFYTPQGKVSFIIADVCDKGLAAALFMSLVRSLLRAFSQQYAFLREMSEGKGKINWMETGPNDKFDLLNTIRLTNAYIGANHQQAHMFATLFFGILDPQTGQLIYVNAGHNPPIVFNAAGVKATLPPSGPAVGLIKDARYKIHQTQLAVGDTLLAYTDGITEARDPEQRPFTTERLIQQLAPCAHSAVALLEKIDSAVHQHTAGGEPFDDIALIAVRHMNN
ncbi:MAG: SpoIIE family protein phosphatase [Ardenticatenaceae bacterium]|nr:SpoIIE family protein phosphatase [Ardenticatenaceae bacterium]MCB9445366.1 SpoIIE family protein phosphatase [Ardenticatenaceae bacterium]